MSAEAQNRLFGDLGGDTVEIETSGRVIRPAIGYVSTVVDETKLRFDDDGLHVKAVDVANVHALRLDVYAEAFETYEFDGDERVVGVNVGTLENTLTNARKRNDDPVSLTIGDSTVRVSVEREYGETTVETHDEILTIDPNALREEPEFPDLGLSNYAEFSPRPFADAIDHLSNGYGAIKVAGHDGDLELIGHGSDDIGGAAVTFRDAADVAEPDAASVFSTDYLEDTAAALTKGYADDVRLKWGDEFPYRLEFTRYAGGDGETPAIEGMYFQAPRIGGAGE